MRIFADTGQICHQLTAGDGPAILVVDFPALNGASRLSGLLSDEAAGQRIFQVDPLGALSRDRLYASLPELADEAAAIFSSAESSGAGQRVFIVSHCSAAGLCMHIAGRLAPAREVTTILVQPSWPGTEHIAERFAEFQEKLGASSRPCPALDGDPLACVAGIEQILREQLTELVARHGLSATTPAFTELLVSYRAWLSFLLACHNDEVVKVPEAVTVSVLTDDPGFALPGAAPGRCRITPPPPLERPDAVTTQLAKLVLDQISSTP